jgi:hypothetical protein
MGMRVCGTHCDVGKGEGDEQPVVVEGVEEEAVRKRVHKLTIHPPGSDVIYKMTTPHLPRRKEADDALPESAGADTI